jgi:hypothetical protein
LNDLRYPIHPTSSKNPCEGIVLKDTESANEWKLELIKAAQHSILLFRQLLWWKNF